MPRGMDHATICSGGPTGGRLRSFPMAQGETWFATAQKHRGTLISTRSPRSRLHLRRHLRDAWSQRVYPPARGRTLVTRPLSNLSPGGWPPRHPFRMVQRSSSDVVSSAVRKQAWEQTLAAPGMRLRLPQRDRPIRAVDRGSNSAPNNPYCRPSHPEGVRTASNRLPSVDSRAKRCLECEHVGRPARRTA
jgi:hypothetical protein